MTNEIVKVISESGVEQTTAVALTESFMPFFNQAKEWYDKAKELVVTDVSQVEEMKQAREARLALVKVRTSCDKKRKELKEDSNRYGKAVQSIYNAIEALILPTEEHLKEQEEFAERIEKKRKDELKARREIELQPYSEVVAIDFIDLGSLSEDQYQLMLSGAITQLQAKRDAEKKAEEERIAKEKAEEEERERIRIENEKLKAEAVKREKEAEEERKKQAAILAEQQAESARKQKEIEDAAKAEREKAEEESRKLREALEAKEKAERDEKQRIENERKAKEAEEKRMAKAPDKQKMTVWIDGFVMGACNAKTDDGQRTEKLILEKFNAFKVWAKQQIETL